MQVKAVQKFKRLIDGGNTPMKSILGEGLEPHFVQPPLSMQTTDDIDELASDNFESYLDSSTPVQESSKIVGGDAESISSHAQDSGALKRKRGSGAMVSSNSGDQSKRGSRIYDNVASKPNSPAPDTPRADTPSKQSFNEGTRGHARDPLEEETLFLFIGPSTLTGTPVDDDNKLDYFSRDAVHRSVTAPGRINNIDALADFEPPPPAAIDDVPIVSESPSAAEENIYETAYREEVERIRSRSLQLHAPTPKVYLTRRVENTDTGLSSLVRQATQSGLFREGRSTTTGETDKTNDKSQETLESGDASTTPTTSSKAASIAGTSISTRATSSPITTTATSSTTATGTSSVGEKPQGGLRSLLERVRRGSMHLNTDQ